MLREDIDIMVAKVDIPKGLENYIKIRTGEVFVNWKELGGLKRKVPCGEIDLETFQLIFDNALEYLLDREVLTFSRNNSWRIVAVGSDFGPKTSYGQDHMNFTRERDAREYLEAFHSDTQFSVGIERLT